MTKKHDKKCPLAPRLRFPEFHDAGEWAKMQLSKIAIPVSERATDGDAGDVLTLSAEYGIVTQGAYFGKKVAGDDLKRYIRIKNNDFVYNDRTTKIYKYGTIKRLSCPACGIVSPIYKCFRFTGEEIPVFWEWYFESGEHDAQLHSIINEGAKAGRFNISIQKFLSIFVYVPDKLEQQRIAGCLSSLDERIAAETSKLKRLKEHKKGLLGRLFPAEGETLPRLRFPEFRDAREWEEVMVTDLLTESCQIGSKGNKAKKLTVKLWGKGVFEKEETFQGSVNTQYYRRRAGQFIYSKLDFLNQAFGIIPHYLDGFESTVDLPCFDFRSDVNPVFFLEYVKREAFYKKFGEIADGGRKAKRIQVDVFLSFPVLLPPQTKEQQKIADCLSSLDELITAQTQKIDLLKDHKKGLMQQLFPRIDEGLA